MKKSETIDAKVLNDMVTQYEYPNCSSEQLGIVHDELFKLHYEVAYRYNEWLNHLDNDVAAKSMSAWMELESCANVRSEVFCHHISYFGICTPYRDY